MKVVIAGDFCPNNRVSQLIDENQFSRILSEIKPITEHADYSILNFECPVALQSFKPIIKQGPNLCCSSNAVQAIKYSGFQCVTLANNHFRDYGNDGCNMTLDTLKNFNIDYVGGGRNLAESQKVLYKKVCNKTLAIINCCEHEFSIATNISAGSAPLDVIDLYHQICDAKVKADYVVVITHGGREYTQYPSPRLQKTYRWLVDIGADVVVNHHQHCYSGYEIYNNKPIIYGLGNFCFDETKQMSKSWYEGYIVSISFDDTISFELIPYIQCKKEPCISLMRGDDYDSFFLNINDINSIISDPIRLTKEFEKYSATKFSSIETSLTPYSGRYGIGLFRRGLLPSFITRKKLLQLQNIVECEARRDELELFFKQKIRNEQD